MLSIARLAVESAGNHNNSSLLLVTLVFPPCCLAFICSSLDMAYATGTGRTDFRTPLSKQM